MPSYSDHGKPLDGITLIKLNECAVIACNLAHWYDLIFSSYHLELFVFFSLFTINTGFTGIIKVACGVKLGTCV